MEMCVPTCDWLYLTAFFLPSVRGFRGFAFFWWSVFRFFLSFPIEIIVNCPMR